MLKFTIKICLISMLLLNNQFAQAETKLYQYDGKLPFVQMMLNMMVAMGILDRLPANSAYGSYARPGFPTSPWMRSASHLNGSGVNSLWENTAWGVLPYNGYAGDRWSNDLSGWVNEPWEQSSWNARAEHPVEEMQKPSAVASVPLVQNFNYNVAEDKPAPANQNKLSQSGSGNAIAKPDYAQSRQRPLDNRPSLRVPATNRSPLSKMAPPGNHYYNNNQAPPKYPAKAGRASKNSQQPRYAQRACITEFCGLKKPDMNGLWVSQNGEMLGINHQRYLWSDGKARYLTGQIKIQNEYLLANVDGHEKLMRFKYKLAGNRLLTIQPDGVTREFVRVRR